MHILSDRHSSSFVIHFNLIISLLSQISVTSSLQDFPFIHILCQQTAQDTLLSKPRSPSERCVCSRQTFLIRNFRWFDCGGLCVGVKSRTCKSQAKSLHGPRFCSLQRYRATRSIESRKRLPRVHSSNLFWRRDCFLYPSCVQAQKSQQKGSRTRNASGEPSSIGPRSDVWPLWIPTRSMK